MHEKNLLVYLYFLINIGPLLESDRTIINVTQGFNISPIECFKLSSNSHVSV